MANSDGTRVSADEAKRRNIEQDDDSNPGILDEDNVFEVEKIVGRTKVDGKALYRVRWLGYGPQSDTWEPYENLLTCKDLVEEYVEREQKKKKRSPGEKSVKKKRINLNESKEDEELSAGNYSSKELEGSKQLKDTFWKDLEEGRINVFAEDMYSKVKGRSARHQNVSDDQSKKQRKAKTKHLYDGNSSDTSLIDGSKGKHRSQKTLRKSRKRVLVISSSSDASEEENAEGQETNTGSEETSVEEMNDSMSFGETKQNAAETSTSEHAANVKTSIDGESDATMSIDLLKSTLGNSTDDNDPNNNNSNNNNNDNNNNDDDNNNNTAITINNNFNNNIDDHNEESLTQDRNNNDNSEFSSDKDNQKQVQIHKEESTEILKDLPQEEFVNNKINATHKEKNTPAPDSSGQYSFEFSRYNPEDWIKKEAYDSRRIELTNSQFRHAVKRGDYELLRRALNGPHRCNLEQADINGMTLLMIAALCGFDDIVELLVIHGANINAVQRNGSTALMFASEFGHICCVAVLLGLGAHVDIQQHSGETSLMKACKKGYRQIVQLLLEYGANFAMVTNSDTTALKLAKLYDHPAIESLLIDHISRVTAAFEAQVNVTLNNTAHIVHALFPLHCFSLNEGNAFKINFNYQLQPPQAGVGMLLFIAHARITPQEVKCRFYGACAVISVFLNGVRQLSLTEEANFVLSFSPLRNGKNELLINTVPAVSSKAKLLVCAYKAQLNGNR